MKNDTILTYEGLISLAKENYENGGDGIVECWDRNTYDTYVSMFGPMTVSGAYALFNCDADSRAMQRW